MTWRWASDTVTRIRPQIVEDAHGDERPDWVNADRLEIPRVSFAPKEDGDGGSIYALRDLDIRPEDHVLWRDRRFEVLGTPQDWGVGTVVIVGGVDIPGQ